MKPSPNRFFPSLRSASLFLLLILPATSPLRGQESRSNDMLFRAMRDELTRTVDRLRLEEQARPYFVEYRVTENRGVTLQGVFGALTRSQPYRGRRLAVTVRVGDYGYDNTGFLSREDIFSSFSSMGAAEMVLDDDYLAIRRDLWLATDKAYKEAVQQLAAKNGYLKSRISRDSLADFSREDRVVFVDSSELPEIDTAFFAEKVRRWSALFRNYPGVDQSAISCNFSTTRFYLMNNEWTQLVRNDIAGTITIDLSTHAGDGTKLARSFEIPLTSPDDLPSDKEMEQHIRMLAEELATFREGKTLEETYIGPVLLVEDAAPQFFLQTLVPHLSGSRLPLTEDESLAGFVGSENPLANRINRRIMPRDFTVYDDPTIRAVEGIPLRGNYDYDHQGVAARRVSIVENGVLKHLLASRRPGKELPGSNGHGRGVEEPGTAIGSLFIESSEMLSNEEMKRRLIETCRELELDYGIMIRNIGSRPFSSISGGGISVSFGSDESEGSGMQAWKVYVADGREEPLRNIEPGSIDFRVLKDIVAAGGERNVLNTQTTPHGVIGFATVPASVIAPSVLLEEVQINPSGKESLKPALLTHPYFD